MNFVIGVVKKLGIEFLEDLEVEKKVKGKKAKNF